MRVIAKQILDALVFVHANNIIHCDIKVWRAGDLFVVWKDDIFACLYNNQILQNSSIFEQMLQFWVFMSMSLSVMGLRMGMTSAYFGFSVDCLFYRD